MAKQVVLIPLDGCSIRAHSVPHRTFSYVYTRTLHVHRAGPAHRYVMSTLGGYNPMKDDRSGFTHPTWGCIPSDSDPVAKEAVLIPLDGCWINPTSSFGPSPYLIIRKHADSRV